MALNFDTPTRDRELPPEGQTTGRIYSVVDWGLQTVTYLDQVKHQPKLSITWELLNKPMKDGRPFVVSQAFTVSLNAKGKLLPMLKALYGVRFKVEDKDGHTKATLDGDPFEARMLLNTYCKVTVVHNDSRDGSQTYANIQSISQMPTPEPGDPPVKLPPAVNPDVFFDLADPDMAVFDKLNKYNQDKIRASREWGKIHQQAPKEASPEDEDPYAGAPSGAPATDEDIPF